MHNYSIHVAGQKLGDDVKSALTFHAAAAAVGSSSCVFELIEWSCIMHRGRYINLQEGYAKANKTQLPVY
jgi:hypothetical protein